jgi:hypothetical protein
VGDVFTWFDGVWTGSNARDTRYWWEPGVGDEEWTRMSGGQGNEPWVAPTLRRIRAGHVAGALIRAGGVEYARVAGGRLAARVAEPGSAALAGVVTLVPRDPRDDGRVEELLALFNSRIGAALAATLSAGLNFNPGYAARLPLGRDAPGDELRREVRRLVMLRRRVVAADPTADEFTAALPAEAGDDLRAEIARRERQVEEMLAAHLGIDAATLSSIPAPVRPRRRVDPVSDRLMVCAVEILGFRWPRRPPGVPPELRAGGRGLGTAELARRMGEALAADGALPDRDLVGWVARDLLGYHATRFRRRPVVTFGGGRFACSGAGSPTESVAPAGGVGAQPREGR